MHVLSLEQWITTVFVKALGVTFLHSIWQALLALTVCYIILAIGKKSTPAVRYNQLLLVSLVLAGVVATTFILQIVNYTNVVNHPAMSSVQHVVHSNYTVAAPVIRQSTYMIGVASDLFNNNIQLLIAIWFVVCCFKWMQLFLGLNYVTRITLYGSSAVGDKWQNMFETLTEKLGIDKKIRLLQSDIIHVPMTAGFWKPVIVMPVSMLANLSPHIVESVLLHELAHVRRGDYLLNLVQSVAETIFFFNPFIIKMSALIREEREACCDAIAVSAIDNKVNYVNALVAFGEFGQQQTATALAFGGSKNSLLDRVKRILLNQNKKPGVMEKTILACSLVLLLAFSLFSSAKGTEEKVNRMVVNRVQAFIQDTIPSEDKSDKPNKREERQARKREKQDNDKKLSRSERRELEKALKELKVAQEELQKRQKELEVFKKEHIEQALLEAQKAVADHKGLQPSEIERIKQEAVAQADRARSQMKIVQEQLMNKELQAALANTQVQLQNTVALNNVQQKLQLEKYMNDSVLIQLKHLNINVNNPEIDQVLGFLEENNVAKAKDITSFSLDQNQLVVNGKVQPAHLHEQLKNQYLGAQGDHINYMRSGNSISVSIQRNRPDVNDDGQTNP